MLTRLLSIAFVSVFSIAAQAQLHSDRYSPINYLGRYSGFGYSEGYHACKEGGCKSGSMGKSSMLKPWESLSSFYGSATAPPDNRVIGNPIAPMRTTSVAPLYTKPYFSTPSDMQPMDVVPTLAPITNPSPQPSTFAPLMNLPQRTPTPPHKHESVPPAPMPKQSSPSDRDLLELPTPVLKSEYIPSSTRQSQRVLPGSRSLIQ